MERECGVSVWGRADGIDPTFDCGWRLASLSAAAAGWRAEVGLRKGLRPPTWVTLSAPSSLSAAVGGRDMESMSAIRSGPTAGNGADDFNIGDAMTPPFCTR